MRVKIRYLLAALVVAALAWVAAPALSSQPYMPGAVDFQQRLPGVLATGGAAAKRAPARAGRGPVSFRSPVILAPKRFDLVGLAGELRPLEIRAREAGGGWSAWVEAEDGNPVYAGGADELQVRARGWRPRGTLHYVNVSGTAGTADGLLTAARRGINSAFIAAAGVVDPVATAAPPRPSIVTRAQWGANLAQGGCPPRARPSYGEVKAGVVHHTVTTNEYSRAEAPSIVLGICRYHRNANGWNDIGYNALVDRFGTLYAGRAGGLRKAVIGAQAQGFNAQTTAIASIGTHTSEAPSAEAVASIVDFLAWKLAAHRVNVRGRARLVSGGGSLSRYPAGRRVRAKKVVGHRALGLTACPGGALASLVPKIRRRVRARIAEDGGGTQPPEVTPPEDGGGTPPKRPAQLAR